MKGAIVLVAIVLASFHSAVAQEEYIELRAGFTKDGMTYRDINYSHTFKNGNYIDFDYSGVPGQNEFWFGYGHSGEVKKGFEAGAAAYLVVGAENKQLGLGLGTYGEAKSKKLNFTYQAYAFTPFRGEVKSYFILDTADVTVNVGKKHEVGVSTAAFLSSQGSTGHAGPIYRYNDKWGYTSVSVLMGSYTEVRFSRTFSW